LLTRVSWAYNELNRFAPVLALTRIARHDGVELPTIAAPARGEATPLAITIGDEGLQVLPAFDREKLAAPSIERLDSCLMEAAMSSEKVRKFLDDDERITKLLLDESGEGLDDPDLAFAASVLHLGLRLSAPQLITDTETLDADVARGCNCTTSSVPLGGWLWLLPILTLVWRRRTRRA
jgi:MYXO-CTERM domain-containing protein